MRTRMCIIASVLVAALSVPAVPAIAKTSPTQDAYGQVIAEVVTPSKPQQQTQAQQQAPVAAAPTRGALPFTGLQVTLVLLAGAALLGVGVALRRATSR